MHLSTKYEIFFLSTNIFTKTKPKLLIAFTFSLLEQILKNSPTKSRQFSNLSLNASKSHIAPRQTPSSQPDAASASHSSKLSDRNASLSFSKTQHRETGTKTFELQKTPGFISTERENWKHLLLKNSGDISQCFISRSVPKTKASQTAVFVESKKRLHISVPDCTKTF